MAQFINRAFNYLMYRICENCDKTALFGREREKEGEGGGERGERGRGRGRKERDRGRE